MEGHSKGNPVRIEQVISIALVGNKTFMQERAIKGEGPIPLLRVTGYANEQSLVPSKIEGRRDTHYIKGAFDATNLLTNEHYISGQVILPDSASGYIGAILNKRKDGFDLDLTITLERAEKSIVGYKFSVVLNNAEDLLAVSTPTSGSTPTPNMEPEEEVKPAPQPTTHKKSQ